MICSGCEIWEENQRLRTENSELREQLAQRNERIAELEIQNGKLKRRLSIYEEARAKPRRKPPRRRREVTRARFPGRPKGCPGVTRPVPKPDILVEAEEVSDCMNCGAPLGPPLYSKEKIVEELPNLQPMKVVAYKEDHYFCSNCDCEVVARHPDCPPDGRSARTSTSRQLSSSSKRGCHWRRSDRSLKGRDWGFHPQPCLTCSGGRVNGSGRSTRRFSLTSGARE